MTNQQTDTVWNVNCEYSENLLQITILTTVYKYVIAVEILISVPYLLQNGCLSSGYFY